MRHRPSSPQGPLRDALESVVFLLILCAAAFVLWFWGEIGMPWEIKAAGYLTAFFGLLNLFLLSVLHTLRLLRAVLAEWRQVFPRRAAREHPRQRTPV